MIVVSGILTGYYALALKDKVFHKWNRFYLLFTVGLALLLPLISIDVIFPAHEQGKAIQIWQAVSVHDEVVVNLDAANAVPAVNLAIGFGYLLISCLLTIGLVRSVLKIRQIRRCGPVQKAGGIEIVQTTVKGSPFSFFNCIFWNTAIDLQSSRGQQIFQHEVAHITEKHSYDKVWIQLVLLLFWINPFFWFIRRELHMIHEFVADKIALEGADTQAFAAMILASAYPDKDFSITNRFFYSPIKRRLLMLSKNNKKKVHYASRLMVLPLAVIVFFAFAFKIREGDRLMDGFENEPAHKEQISQKPADFSDNHVSAGDASSKTTSHGDRIAPIADTLPGKKIKSYEVLPEEDKVIIRYADGTQETLKGSEAQKRGFVFPPVATPPPPPPPLPPGPPPPPQVDFDKLPKVSLYILDGKEVDVQEIEKIEPDQIASINVLKGEPAVKRYGEKARGGVIHITTRRAPARPGTTISPKSPADSNAAPAKWKTGDPIIYIDGKKGKIEDVDKEDIAAVNVFKGQEALKRFGPEAKAGVVEIITKSSAKTERKKAERNFTEAEDPAAFSGDPEK